MSDNPAQGALLVGSMPLDSEEEVFKYAAKCLGAHLKRIPDGEPKERNAFVSFQGGIFDPQIVRKNWSLQPRQYSPEEVKQITSSLPERYATMYDDAAIASWATFQKLQAAGIIPASTRFQVSLPTPMNTVLCFIEEQLVPLVEPVYERSMRAAIDNIQTAIPHDKLAIQLDAAVEFSLLEDKFYDVFHGGRFTPWFNDALSGIAERIVRCMDAVHDDVELGLHLCYGDAGHRHFAEPADLRWCVAVANAVAGAVRRPLTWVHMPVPKGRVDAEFFAPLTELDLHGGATELYLGLVHANDEEGTRQRVDAARQFVGSFGVATECGMGRTPVEDMSSNFKIAGAVAQPW